MWRAVLFILLATLTAGCAPVVTQQKSETAAKVTAAEVTRAAAVATIDIARRIRRVTTRTRKPSGETTTTTTTDIGVDTKAASATSVDASRAIAAESAAKSDLTTKTRGWKWYASFAAGIIAIALISITLLRTLIRRYV